MPLAQQVEKILEYVAWTIIWNKYFAIMFLVLGLYLTIGTRFFQFRRFGDIMRNTVGTMFQKADDRKDKGSVISSFGAFAAALGGSVGNGNIAGVASAIAIGGPGALFWMWVAALVSMSTKMCEIVLVQTYKQRYPDGSSYGSAAFYVQKGLVEEKGWKWAKVLSVLFTATMLMCFYFSPGPYTVVESVQAAFKLSKTAAILCAIAYTTSTYIIILGGMKRIIKFATAVVPSMILLYFVAGFFVILHDIPALVEGVKSIFIYAFKPMAAVGGFAGVTIAKTLQVGIARSVYSNEAGWGSSPIIHASVDVDHPGRQGMWGAFEVFVDTIIVCTITGLIVIVTGAWQTGMGGAGSVGDAFSRVFGPYGGISLAIFIVTFSLTTTTGWYSYLESLVIYIVQNKTAEERRRIVKAVRLSGPICTLGFAMFFFYIETVPAYVWMMLDIQAGVPVYVNLVAIALLSPVAFKKIREFEDNYLNPERDARKAAKLAKKH